MAHNASHDATKPNGDLEKIGLIQKRLQLLKKNKSRGQGLLQPRPYFRSKILEEAVKGLDTNSLEVDPQRPKTVGRKRRAEDIEVNLKFFDDTGKKDRVLSREAIHSIIHNCEIGGSQVWKLRRLVMNNADGPKRGKEVPKKTVEDNWVVRAMTFVRRQPAAKAGKSR